MHLCISYNGTYLVSQLEKRIVIAHIKIYIGIYLSLWTFDIAHVGNYETVSCYSRCDPILRGQYQRTTHVIFYSS